MKLARSPSASPAWLFAVPAIQLPLLLVFFFFMGSSYLLQPGVGVSLPDSPFVLSPRKEPVVVAVPAPPSSAFYFEDRTTDLAGLRAALAGLRGRRQTIIVRADRGALYERVFEAMNAALEAGLPVVLASSEDRDAP